jgi:hypothetical protein
VESAVGNNAGAGAGGNGQGAVLSFSSSAGPKCAVSLLGRRIAVRKRASAILRLVWSGAKGTLTCRGKLTLSLKVKLGGSVRKRYKNVSIGTSGFSIRAGTSAYVTVRLNARGRARLRAGHGRLAARVTILVSSPTHGKAQASTVHLVRRRASKS